MDTATITSLKQDFADWSGGFPPDSTEQITVYIDYSLSAQIDPEEARQVLVEWMQHEAATQ